MPATPTYILLNQITLAAASSSVTFSNIPQNYGDLVLCINGSLSSSGVTQLNPNGDSANTNRSAVYMSGSVIAGASSGTLGAQNVRNIGSLNGTSRFNAEIQLMDYSATDKHKTFLIRYDDSAVATEAMVQRYAVTTALTSLNLTTSGGNFTVGTTFYLYGVYA